MISERTYSRENGEKGRFALHSKFDQSRCRLLCYDNFYYLRLFRLGIVLNGRGLKGCLTKSIHSTEGIRKEKTVLPSLFVTAKSPRFMIFIPIKTLVSISSQRLTSTFGMIIRFGSQTFTIYLFVLNFPAAVWTSTTPIGFRPHPSTTRCVMAVFVAPVSQIALYLWALCSVGLFLSAGVNASEIRTSLERTLLRPVL